MRVPKPPKFLEIIILDSLGILLMIAAILTGWLPGPGGIPLFIVGLSLLAVNHEWAKRHIDSVQRYVKKANDFIFTKNPRVQLAYDLICPLVIALGIWLLRTEFHAWKLSLGIFLIAGGLVIILGNRNRIQRLKQKLFSNKHK